MGEMLHDWAYEKWSDEQDAIVKQVDQDLDEVMGYSLDKGAGRISEAIDELYDSRVMRQEFHRALFALWRKRENKDGAARELWLLLDGALARCAAENIYSRENPV